MSEQKERFCEHTHEYCSNDHCHSNDNGFCPEHNVEIERRKSMASLTQNIPRLLTAVNRLIGWSAIVTILILGSYAYILIVKQDLREEIKTNTVKNEKVVEDLNDIKSLIKSNNVNQGWILKEVRNNNQDVLRYIESFHGGKPPPPRPIDDYHKVPPDLEID